MILLIKILYRGKVSRRRPLHVLSALEGVMLKVSSASGVREIEKYYFEHVERVSVQRLSRRLCVSDAEDELVHAVLASDDGCSTQLLEVRFATMKHKDIQQERDSLSGAKD